MDRGACLRKGHPTLGVPMRELELHVSQGMVLVQGPRKRLDLIIEAMDESSRPAGVTEVAFHDPAEERAALQELATRPPEPSFSAPDGVDREALNVLREASRVLFDLEERSYGRLPGGEPPAQEMGEAMLAVLAAWPAVLASPLDRSGRSQLGRHLGLLDRPPDTLLSSVLRFTWPGSAPASFEAVVQRTCEVLRRDAGEYVVVLHARSLIRDGQATAAVALLREHGSTPDGPSAVLEQVVSVAEALAEAGAVEEACERLSRIAGRVWGDEKQRLRARELLRALVPEGSPEAERERWDAADMRRATLLRYASDQ